MIQVDSVFDDQIDESIPCSSTPLCITQETESEAQSTFF